MAEGSASDWLGSAWLRVAMVHVTDQTVNHTPHAPMGGKGASGNGTRFSCLTASATPTRHPF